MATLATTVDSVPMGMPLPTVCATRRAVSSMSTRRAPRPRPATTTPPASSSAWSLASLPSSWWRCSSTGSWCCASGEMPRARRAWPSPRSSRCLPAMRSLTSPRGRLPRTPSERQPSSINHGGSIAEGAGSLCQPSNNRIT
eukprot:scaffold448577_cov37-Prasinocladus_malaysianus.AAC.1